jgi:pyruvate carboxylase
VIWASRHRGWPKALQDKVLKGDEAYTERPGSLLPDADLEAERKEIETKLEREVSENEFASYLMYPKVFTDFALATETYGPVSMLPTPAYFYGIPVAASCSSRSRRARRW